MKAFLGIDEKALGDILKAYRKANGMTQKTVAEYLDVDRSTYGKYETSRIPETEAILKLSALYQVSLDDIFKSFFAEESKKNSGSVVALNAPDAKNVVEVSEAEMRLLSFYRDSMRKTEIMKKAEDIYNEDNEIIEEIKNV